MPNVDVFSVENNKGKILCAFVDGELWLCVKDIGGSAAVMCCHADGAGSIMAAGKNSSKPVLFAPFDWCKKEIPVFTPHADAIKNKIMAAAEKAG